MKRLFAGPFVGEFGHELFCWQGIIRELSRRYDHTTIYCMTGKSVLYEDFADDIIEYNVKKYDPNGAYNNSNEQYPMPSHDCDYIGPNHALEDYNEHGFKNKIKQTYVRYGNKTGKSYDYIIHARSTTKHGTSLRNWSVEKWNKLIQNLNGSVACIGTTAGAYHIKGTDDLRNLPLSDLVEIISASKLIIGPSSGPIHLASLCGTPQLVWSGDSNKNKKRYEIDWNPHKIPVFYLKNDTWNPTVCEILDCLKCIN